MHSCWLGDEGDEAHKAHVAEADEAVAEAHEADEADELSGCPSLYLIHIYLIISLIECYHSNP